MWFFADIRRFQRICASLPAISGAAIATAVRFAMGKRMPNKPPPQARGSRNEEKP